MLVNQRLLKENDRLHKYVKHLERQLEQAWDGQPRPMFSDPATISTSRLQQNMTLATYGEYGEYARGDGLHILIEETMPVKAKYRVGHYISHATLEGNNDARRYVILTAADNVFQQILKDWT